MANALFYGNYSFALYNTQGQWVNKMLANIQIHYDIQVVK